jgi:hypothetical protein
MRRVSVPRRPVSRMRSLVQLENRLVPAVVVNFSHITGILSVLSDASDAIVLTADNHGQVQLYSTTLVVSGEPVLAAAVAHIEIAGGPGANLIDLSGVNATWRSLFEESKRPPKVVVVGFSDVPEFEDVIRSENPPAALLTGAARVLSKSSAHVTNETVRESYAARAVALLNAAREQGYCKDARRLESLRSIADFEPLRERNDFKLLLKEIEGNW